MQQKTLQLIDFEWSLDEVICLWCYCCVVEIRAWILEVACCEFSSKFTPLHLTVWTVCSKSEATPSIYWSSGKSPLFFLWRFGLSNFVSVIIREQKGLRKRDYLEKCPGPLYKFPRNWFLYDMISWERHDALHVSNNWLHMFKWSNVKELTLRKIRNMQLPIFKLLSQLHSRISQRKDDDYMTRTH